MSCFPIAKSGRKVFHEWNPSGDVSEFPQWCCQWLCTGEIFSVHSDLLLLFLLLSFKDNLPGFRHNVFISGRIKLCNSLFSDYAYAAEPWASSRFASQVCLPLNTCCTSFQDQQWETVTKSLFSLLIQMQHMEGGKCENNRTKGFPPLDGNWARLGFIRIFCGACLVLCYK